MMFIFNHETTVEVFTQECIHGRSSINVGSSECACSQGLDNSVCALAIRESQVAGPKSSERLELGLRDFLDVFDNKPVDAFSAGWRGEGAIIVIEFAYVDCLKEPSQVQLSSC